MENKPNIVLILNDDMGYSDIGCYGGEVQTPNLDRLAANGVRFSQFYNTARCCPSRASLLTGLHPHQADVGHMMQSHGVDGYLADLSKESVTIAEVLKTAGYANYMSGKWHVTRHINGPKHNWPLQRGFDDYYGIIDGAANYFDPESLTRDNERIKAPEGDYFLTDAISDEAVRQIRDHSKSRPDIPFFQYVAYTAPHWPLHAHEEDVRRYAGRFESGWDALRQERLERMVDMGILDPAWELTPRDPTQLEWTWADHKEWNQRRMEVYAAQIDRMDQGIGRIIDALDETGRLENTLVMFLSDNGGCAEEIEPDWTWFLPDPGPRKNTRDGVPIKGGNIPSLMPGGEETYQSYGVPWANLSNTPFREYKHWVHEGGISTPFIAHWPARIRSGGRLEHRPAQLPDIMATCVELGGAQYPAEVSGRKILPLEGYSMASLLEGGNFAREVLYWEHEGNRAVRKGKWKLVIKYPGAWELYDIEADRTELHDLAGEHPDVVAELSALYDEWAERCGVSDWTEMCRIWLEKHERA